MGDAVVLVRLIAGGCVLAKVRKMFAVYRQVGLDAIAARLTPLEPGFLHSLRKSDIVIRDGRLPGNCFERCKPITASRSEVVQDPRYCRSSKTDDAAIVIVRCDFNGVGTELGLFVPTRGEFIEQFSNRLATNRKVRTRTR